MIERFRWAFFVVCVLSSLSAMGQAISVGSNNSAFALFSQAHTANGLNDPNLRPWHIKASYKTFDDVGNAKNSGVFEEWWAGPKQYKRSFTSQNFTRTEYVTDTGTYSTGNANFPPDEELLMVARLFSPIDKADDDTIYRLQSRTFGQTTLRCVILAKPMIGYKGAPESLFPTYCFSSDQPTLRWRGSYGQYNALYNGIRVFQGKSVGQDLSITEATNLPVAKASVETLETLESVDAASFLPPADAIHQEYPSRGVAEPGIVPGRILKTSDPIYPDAARKDQAEGVVILVAAIGQDGRVHELTVKSAPEVNLAGAALVTVRQWKFSPYLFHGKPVQVNAEFNVDFTMSHQLF